MTTEKKLHRIEFHHESVEERVKHFHEFKTPLTAEEIHEQALRCLHCGTPYCSSSCPLHNRPVDWNRLVREGKWRDAWECLNATNNFPEVTSRICPCLCEAGCTQYLIEDSAVGIQTIERSIIDRAWKSGWVQPEVPLIRTGKKVAVIGSGPSGLACAQQLAREGHLVTVFEKNDRAGGLMALGIPDFKLEKPLIDRRLEQMKAEGVTFELGTAVGTDKFDEGVHSFAKKVIPAEDVIRDFDAVVLALGSEAPRDLKVPGRDAKGVNFALDLLIGQNREDSGAVKKAPISAKGCDVAIIGGGDTGSDCVGTVRRQGAGKVYLIDVGSEPPEHENKAETWPNWPRKMRISTSHEEGCEKLFQVSTKEIVKDKKGEVTAIRCVKLKVDRGPDGRLRFQDIPGTEFEIPVQRVYLAMGFLHPSSTVLDAFGVEKDARGNAKTDRPYFTSREKVFACGDARRGQSLIVTATSDGRQCAAAVDAWLMGRTALTVFAK